MLGMCRGLWQYRHFVISSIRNELISRFARSKLGGLWMIINPLAQVAIYALILSRSEEHTSELQSLTNLVCRLLLDKNNRRGPRRQHP